MKTSIYIYLFLTLCLIGRIFLSCTSDIDQSEKIPTEREQESIIQRSILKGKDTVKINPNYNSKYFNEEFISIPGLREKNSNDSLIIDLISGYDQTTSEQKKYYYYLLSQEKEFRVLNPTQKIELKQFMDNLFFLELETANYYNNSISVNNRLLSKNRSTLDVPNLKIKNKNIASIYHQKPKLEHYGSRKKIEKQLKKKISSIDHPSSIQLPTLKKRTALIQYKLNKYLYQSDKTIIETSKKVKSIQDKNKISTTSDFRKLSTTDPLIYNHLNRNKTNPWLLDSVPLKRPEILDFKKFPFDDLVMPKDTHIIIFTIIGEDDRMEPYDNAVQQAAFLKPIDQAMAIIHKDRLKKINDSTYQLINYKKLETQEISLQGAYLPICDETRFETQPVISMCTGFAITDDILATANHCLSFSNGNTYQDYYWVFDYKMTSDSTFSDTFSVDLVFKPVELIKGNDFYENDFSLLRADKSIPEERIIKQFDTSSDLEIGDSIFMVGYPLGLPLKITPNGTITDLLDYYGDYSPFFYCSLDAFQGNSGSPVFLKKNGKCIGFLSSGLKDFERLSTFIEGEEDQNCAQEFVMPFHYDRIEELVQKMEDIYLQTVLEL